jgi:predicted component of viral defense system (DUF524 family)
MKLHFSEHELKISNLDMKKNRGILYELSNRDQIEIINNSVKFKNFTGILRLEDDEYLIIPYKLAKYFGLLDKVDKNNSLINKSEKIYYQSFEVFLKYILKGLLREHLLFHLNLSNFPVEESKINTSKIFKLLILLENYNELIGAIHIILSSPHRKLISREVYKSFDEVSCIDANILSNIVTNSSELYETSKGIINIDNKFYSPNSVLQYKTVETFDTLENRFVKFFLRELNMLVSEFLKEFAFLKELQVLKEEIDYTLQSDIFLGVGDLNYFPSNSQVLLKKPGYRELFQIYRLLHLSYVPKIFETLDLALSLKDMATLWEYYVLIEILKDFKKIFGFYEILKNFEEKLRFKTIYEEAKFRFENGLILSYQRTLSSYSKLQFRPDFYIEYNNKIGIFDAKFRLFNNNKKEILQNMHYYRDGLKTNFAIAVCWSEEKQKGRFWRVDKFEKDVKLISSFSRIIEENLNGIGYINLVLDIKGNKYG